jgi:predicted P-loop ATPase
MPDLDETLRGNQTLRNLLKLSVVQGSITGDNPDDKAFLGDDDSDPAALNRLEQYKDKQGNPTGQAKSSRRNIFLILTYDKRWKGRIWLNDFAGALMIDDREYEDVDDTEIMLWLDQVYKMKVGTEGVKEMTVFVGNRNKKNPLQDWLKQKHWDKSARIHDWLIKATGCEDTELHREVGKRWLIQAIARAMTPGCKADCCLILIGKQGAKKSTLFRTLASTQFFADTPLDIGSPNAYTQIRRAWIYEVAELDSVRRSANSATKAFLSAQEDVYRPAYGRHAVTVKRHVCFAGTTNEAQFISDQSGSRRYWPVKVGNIDLEWVANNRDQLWAEALIEFHAGERWWLEDEASESLSEESEQYRHVDPWMERISDWLVSNASALTTRKILEEGLKLEPNQMTRSAEMRIGEVMRDLGFERSRTRKGSRRIYEWRKREKVIEFEFNETNER